jgi:hypothetical protein
MTNKPFDLETVRFLAEEVARMSIKAVYGVPHSSKAELLENMRKAADVTFEHFMKRIPDDLEEARQLVQSVFDEAFAVEFKKIGDSSMERR